MEICKMLTLGYENVRPETLQAIHDDPETNELGLCIYHKHCYGYFIYFDPEDAYENIPDDLKAVLKLATENGCEVVCFDRDAPACEELPLYEWE